MLNIQPYLDQLLDDLRDAQQKIPPHPDYRLLYPNHPAPEGLEYIIEWENAPYVPMAELMGIDAIAFPPASQLTEGQAGELVDAMLDLWACYHIEADLPEGPPATRLYEALVETWRDRPIQHISEGTMHLEFCDYYPEECQWGEFCHCKEILDEGME